MNFNRNKYHFVYQERKNNAIIYFDTYFSLC